MWAGGRLEFHAPLCVGDVITRASTIESINQKSGRSGTLVFVTVKHEIRRAHGSDVAVTEFQDLVYREPAKPDASLVCGERAPAQSTWSKEWLADEVMLFRYSALTFNAHRIHYDRRYAVDVERYPGLVVHGPLIATLLLELLRAHRPNARVTGFQFRAVRPIFDNDAFTVCGEQDAAGKSVHLWASDAAGSLAMKATAVVD